jgi:hypothetical protein
MRYLALLTIAVAATVLLPDSTEAGCRWEWLCDASGNCAQAPICDSTLDIPPVRPPQIKPIVPPSIKPIAPPTIPPIGTRNCDQVRRCDAYGNCVWDTVCY